MGVAMQGVCGGCERQPCGNKSLKLHMKIHSKTEVLSPQSTRCAKTEPGESVYSVHQPEQIFKIYRENPQYGKLTHFKHPGDAYLVCPSVYTR
jgi:hypothetical protein